MTNTARALYEKAIAKGYAPVGAPAEEMKSKGSALAKAVRDLMALESIEYNAARNRVRRAVKSGGVKRVREEREPDLYEESRAQKLARENATLKARTREALAELSDLSQLRAHAFQLTPDKVRPPGNWTAITRKPSGKREIPILFTSDFQAGEVVKLEDTRGENEYNLEIFRRRYRTMIGVTIKLIEKHHGGADQIVYLRGGDAISGGIHEELADTDEVPAPLQCIAVIEEETAGIRHLADKFGKVHVISVAGNHDRITHKPRSKQYLAHSYEALIQYALEAQFKGDKRVIFTTDPSGDVLFQVHGYRMLLTHGDRIGTGGGQGFLGSGGPIIRGSKKVKAAYAATNQHVDLVLIGHYHTSMYKRGEVICNGSLVGHSEYARSRIRAEPQDPIQVLFFVHEDRGVTAVREIDCNNRPKKSKDALVIR